MKHNQKHHGVVLLALAAVFAFCGIMVNAVTGIEQDKVTVQQEILYGDVTAVEGLSLVQNLAWENRLIWEITTPLDAPEHATTAFSYIRDGAVANTARQNELELSFVFDFSGSTSGSFNFSSETGAWTHVYPDSLFADVASRVPAGKTYTEFVRVADYAAVYTPYVYQYFAPEDGSGYGYSIGLLEESLVEYFSQPVGENDWVQVSMTANDEGDIYEMSASLVQLADGETPAVTDNVALGDSTDEVYSIRIWDNLPTVCADGVTYVLTPRDNAIELCAVRYTKDADTDEMQLDGVESLATLSIDTADTAFTTFSVENLFLQGNELFAFTAQEVAGEWVYSIYVFSLDTMAWTQEITGIDINVDEIFQGDDFFVLYDYFLGDFLLYTEGEDENGYAEYVETMRGNYVTYLPTTEWKGYYTNLDMLYLHDTLVIAVRNTEWGDDALSAYLIAYREEGCVYAARYTTNLQQDGVDDYMGSNQLCNWGDTPLSIQISGI